MTLDDYAKSLLAIVIWREARGDGAAAMQAVAHVILNRISRMQIGTQADKAIKGITAHNQFSSMSVRGDSQTIVWPTPEDSCFQIAEDAYLGVSQDNTNGAQYYANEHVLLDPWYNANIAGSADHPILAVVGKQTFRK